MKYYLSPTISWPVFQKLEEKFARDDGPTPRELTKLLHEMLGERMINIVIDTQSEDPLQVTIEPIPKNAMIIQDPK